MSPHLKGSIRRFLLYMHLLMWAGFLQKFHPVSLDSLQISEGTGLPYFHLLL